MTRKIYLASSWKNPRYKSVVEALRAAQLDLYDFTHTGFNWNKIDAEWDENNVNESQYKNFLGHPLAKSIYNLDYAAMHWANTCVLILPSGRNAHSEAGWCKGQGKEVFVLITSKEERPELMYLMYDDIFFSIDSLLERLLSAART
jgi:hypothetical protein